MEESKELQGFYKIFRTVVYVSVLLEFFEYAIDPEILDHWNGIVCDLHDRIKRWFIYQDGKLIDTLVDMGRFNTAEAEQTEADKRILGKQMKYIHAFDEMISRDGVTPVGTLKSESVKQIASAPAKVVEIPKTEEIDYLNYFKGKDYTRIGQDAV